MVERSNNSRSIPRKIPGDLRSTQKDIIDAKFNCPTVYGKYKSCLGWFDDMLCRRLLEYAAHVCDGAVSYTKYETGRSLSVEESDLKDQEHAISVFSLS